MSASQSSIGIFYAAAILEFQVDEPGGHFCAPCRMRRMLENVDSITGDSIDHGVRKR
jgi:hypothetical protein